MISNAALLLAPVLLLPLLLGLVALLPALRSRVLDLLPIAPLPGLAAAVLAPVGTSLEAPDLLFGLRLDVTVEGGLFLGFASALWIAAGFFARSYMRGSRDLPVFCAFWCLTLFGNLAVFLAGDAATFYLAFACVSLAAYPLVVHERSNRAMQAGLVYIVLALIGEALLLLGMLLAVAAADGILLTDVRQALGASTDGLTVALLVAGFGIKAGMIPLHVWLPLAHPAAPTPASAVLSGAIVKAGIFGLIQFLPVGGEIGNWGSILIWIGVAGAWFGIAVGLTQANPKTILAYSTVSQMGIVVAVIGSAMLPGGGPAALAAASLYALHHGLAKGALFMGVGVAQKAGPRAIAPVMAVLALVALSVAGLPLLGGAFAKVAIKEPLGGGMVEILVAASAAGTSLILLRYLVRLHAVRPTEDAVPGLGLIAPFAAIALAALVAPWFLFADWSGRSLAYAFEWSNIWGGLWPLLVAGVVAAAVLLRHGLKSPAIPEGDLVVPAKAVISSLAGFWSAAGDRFATPFPALRRPALNAASLLAWLEARLSNWAVAGSLMALLVLAMIAANGL